MTPHGDSYITSLHLCGTFVVHFGTSLYFLGIEIALQGGGAYFDIYCRDRNTNGSFHYGGNRSFHCHDGVMESKVTISASTYYTSARY